MIEQYITVGSSGGGSTIADPSSFADANALFLGDRGLTLVSNILDTWENQGSDGNDASAATSTNRIGISAGLGVSGYRSFQPWNDVNFYADGLNTASLTEFTLEGVTTVWANWNPGRNIPSVGDANTINYPTLLWVGSQGFRCTQRVAGTSTNTYWSKAAIGFEYGEPFAWTLVYDGSEAVNADRLKLYVNGVFVASTTTPTHPTAVTNQAGRLFITSYSTSYSSFAEIGGYVGYWERVLSPAEIAENQAWREQIWAVTP